MILRGMATKVQQLSKKGRDVPGKEKALRYHAQAPAQHQEGN
jgi:hypothetical protein